MAPKQLPQRVRPAVSPPAAAPASTLMRLDSTGRLRFDTVEALRRMDTLWAAEEEAALLKAEADESARLKAEADESARLKAEADEAARLKAAKRPAVPKQQLPMKKKAKTVFQTMHEEQQAAERKEAATARLRTELARFREKEAVELAALAEARKKREADEAEENEKKKVKEEPASEEEEEEIRAAREKAARYVEKAEKAIGELRKLEEAAKDVFQDVMAAEEAEEEEAAILDGDSEAVAMLIDEFLAEPQYAFFSMFFVLFIFLFLDFCLWKP